MKDLQSLLQARLPHGVRSEFIDNGNGLLNHVLCAGENHPDKPVALLLHGFPELAFSWRRIMLPLAEAGYFVIAPDQRGYGLTIDQSHGNRIGPISYETPLDSYNLINLARDAIGLINALGHHQVELLVGHDFGSPVAGWSALIRPDIFKRVVMMSAPFAGPPALPNPTLPPAAPGIDIQALSRLSPPRKHYQRYYSTEPADRDMMNAPDGLHQFLRDYYHAKSADWPGNSPHPLEEQSPQALAVMPHYYIMEQNQTMPQAVLASRPAPDQVAQCDWLPDRDLAVYAAMFQATGFQAALQWYRCGSSGQFRQAYQLFGGRHIEPPSCFIAGRQDWGVYQKPGDLTRMEQAVCMNYQGTTLIEGAGHWVQQEQPQQVADLLVKFCRGS
ncbi:MAG: alpha/beta fold hydrolase [Burkholderiaceae bacterium]